MSTSPAATSGAWLRGVPLWVRMGSLLVLLVGLPAGVLVGIGPGDQGYIEFWEFLSAFRQAGTPWLTPLADPVAQAGFSGQAVRPFSLLHVSAAAEFFADPFVGHFILISFAVGLVGVLAYLAFTLLGLSRIRAVAAACVVAWFPAWIGSFMPRTAHFQWGHVFLLGALVLALAWVRGRLGVWAIVVAPIALAASFAFYEAVALAALVLGASVVAAPAPRRRRALAIVVWACTCVFLVGIVGLAVRMGAGTYQAQVTAGGPQWDAIPQAVGMIYRDGLGGIVAPIWGVPSVLAVIVGIVCAGLALLAGASDDRSDDAQVRRRALLIAGIALMALTPVASLVYLSTTAHLLDPLRTFSAVALPLSFGLACLWQWAAGPRAVAAAIGAAAVALAAMNLVGQREFMHDLSRYQSQVVDLVSSAVGGHTHVLVKDSSGTLASAAILSGMAGSTSPYPDFYMLHPQILSAAVSWVAGHPVTVEACKTLRGNPYASVLPQCPAKQAVASSDVIVVTLPPGLRQLVPGAR